jgi:murein hydrolase activator
MPRGPARPLAVAALGLAVGVGLVGSGPAAGQVPPTEAERKAAETERERASRQDRLKAVEDAIAANADARTRLEREVEELRKDRARLSADLIGTAERIAAIEDRARALEERIGALTASEGALRRSLESRRAVIAEVLAALQRVGRRPPPALLARPEDLLSAVRSSILLGSVLPELRAEAEALAVDLGELVRLRQAIDADRLDLARELAGLEGQRERVAALVAARQADVLATERSLAGERERSGDLASQARSLKELIDRMEREVASARKAADEARRAAEAQARETRERFAAASLKDPARLAPKVPFVETKGLLPKPVRGEIHRAFGSSDGYGGTTRGISFTTRPKAIVTSPADGWAVFAGPFRSYGRLLIINTGGGYYILLAGMDAISIEVGQFVLAGEPVAVMGEASSPSPAGSTDAGQPVLYVEFRKDGASIDPGPWWATTQGEKVRG